MTERDDVNLARWLEAEAAGTPDEADRLFAFVAASHLRRIEPDAGLADRILSRLPRPSPRAGFWPNLAWPVIDPGSSLWTKAAILVATLLLGVGVAVVSPRDLFTLLVESGSVAATALGDAAASVGAGLHVWRASLDLMAALGQAAGLVFTTGPMPLLIAANLAIAAVAFAGLRRLLAPREECV